MISVRLRRIVLRKALLMTGGLVLVLGCIVVPGFAPENRVAGVSDPAEDSIDVGAVGQTGIMSQGNPTSPITLKESEATFEETIEQLFTQRPFPGMYPEVSVELSPWREIVANCKRRSLVWAEQESVIQEIIASGVVLVADFHISPVPAIATRQVLEMINGRRGDTPAAPILALEALPVEAQQRVSNIRLMPEAGRRRELRRLLHECWPWPADPIVNLLEQQAVDGWSIAAVGSGCADSDYQAEVEDWRRQAITRELVLYTEGDSPLERTDRNIVSVLQKEREVGGGVVVVLVGGSHILTPESGLKARLEVVGIEPVVLLSYCPQMEIWLRRQLGAEPPPGKWLVLGKHMYRVPAMTAEVIALLRNTRNEYWKGSPGR